MSSLPGTPAPGPATIGGSVKVTIDGRTTRAPLGASLLDAARGLGIAIPTFCHHPEICASGACRVCVVEVEGHPSLEAACTWKLTGPVEVRTATDRVKAARREVLALLMASHDADCTRCGVRGRCDLERLANEYGAAGVYPRRHLPTAALSSARLDPAKCVLCRRCTATMADLGITGVLEMAGRGQGAYLKVFPDRLSQPAAAEAFARAASRCPTGALKPA
jgi:NADH-quinone oxidoreductase subunit G/[NiFe] hydrogenase diaphorase moiety small subunit